MATTHWDKVKTDDGAHREIELLEHFWKILNGRNTKMMRLEPDTWRQDAYRAIDFILGITAPSRGEAPKRGNDKWRLKIIQEDDTFFETGRVDDLIIAIMGSTGVGKSTFLNNAARLYTKDPACFSDPSPVGHSLESCTRNVLHHIAILPRNHPLFPGRRIVFVDTPGFGDTHQDDSDILRRIAAWLANSYSRNAYLAGLIYLSDISQKRVFGSERLNLDVFRKVCGQEFTRIAVATTHWDTVQRLKGEEREGELRKAFWRELIEQGATVHRVEKTPEDVGSIIDAILQAVAKDTRAQVLQIQAELVDMEKTIPLTEAGTKLRHNLRELVDLYKHQLGATSTDQEQKQLEKDIALALDQIERLSVPLTDRVKNWFRGL
ncbi:P-loop containing nucleoside triphosphate hydrolase protein [Coprinopsis sp. MPI-PUGE-AT-0042]|nr:P-loop containing nucleoside triphosphate hydrolase protein [Coprinopsis sp. MPI-PUGE-AT-0042]